MADVEIREFLPSHKSITSSQTDLCKSFSPVLFASWSETLAHNIFARAVSLFFCLLMLSADSYIDVRGRLQVNDLFMHILVDTCANCESRTDLFVAPRLVASSG